jgi:hypothetical protein
VSDGSTTSLIVKGGAGGKVGIGTATPESIFHVYGTGWGQVLLQAGAVNVAWDTLLLKGLGSGAGNIAVNASAVLSLGDYTGSASTSLITTGRVGIGTNGPACPLHVERRTYSSTSRILILTNSTATPYGGAGYDTLVINQDDVPCIRLRETAGANPELTFAVGNENSQSAVIGATGMLRFCTNRNAGTTGYSTTNTRMVIDEANGNVGIGDTNPDAILCLRTTSSYHAILVMDSAGTSNHSALLLRSGGTDKWQVGNEGASDRFRIYSYATASEKVTVLPDGNVGIGTTNPGTWKLRVEGGGFFNGSVVIPNSSNYFGALNSSGSNKNLLYLSSSNEFIMNKDHASVQPTIIRGKYVAFETPDSVLGVDIEVMRVFQGSGFMAAGCVGIGVTTPSSKLDVNGTITGTSKNFNIPHPDPSKINARLIHASVEAPSNDTLYKFEVVISLDNETVTHPLPSYFKYLNKNPRMWIQARDMFSHAYGSCAEDLSSFSITGEKAGNYDVLIIATRKDEGVEGFVVEIDA